MPRITARRALAPCLLGLLAIAACVVNLDFDYTVSAQPVHAEETGNALEAAIPIDLSGQPDIQAHAGQIESLSLTSMDVTVTAVQSDNSVATVTGTLSLRPYGATDSSQDVLVGALDGFAITLTNGIHLLGSPALDAFALTTVQGSQRFQVIISGSTTGGETADFAVDIKLSLSMGYNT